MRNTVRLFAFILVFGLIFFISACKDQEPTPEPTPTPTPEITEYNVLGNWTDGGDSVYTITTNTTSRLSFTYAKAEYSYAYMSSPIITEDLSVFKKLVVTVEGSGTMLLKLETNDGTPAKEIGLNVTGIQGTYQWNLNASAAFLAKVNKVVIIAAPGKTQSVGSITITSLKFGKTVADGFIINDGFNNIPTNVNEYNGTDEIFNFNSKWESSDEGVYVITYDGTEADIAYNKPSGKEWAFLKTNVQGTFTDFNYVVFKIQGTAGHKVIAKPNEYNSIEASIFLDGTLQELVIDLRSLTTAQKNAIVDFKVFIAAGLAPAQGVMTIKEAFMTEDYEFVVPEILVNVYDGTGLSFGLQHFYDGGDMVYDITKVGSTYEVEYEKLTSNLHWAFMFANLDGDFSRFSKLEFEMTGQANKTILLKVESPLGNKELQFTFDGTKQTFVIDLTTMTPAQLAELNKVVMFSAPGGVGSGMFTIHGVTFKTSDYAITSGYESLDAGVYTFTYGATTVVNYTKTAGQDWTAIRNIFDAEKVAGLNTMTIVLKGTAGKSVLVKPNDQGALEQRVDFVDANPVTLTVTAASFVNIILFGEPGTSPATGSFEIVSLVLSYVAPEVEFDPTSSYDFNNNWFINNAGAYTVITSDDKSTVNYTKVAGQEWEWIRRTFDAKDVMGYNTMTIVIHGALGKQVLLKPNDSGALEKFVTFGAEPTVVTVYAETGFTSLFVFGEPNVAPATGSFEILSAHLSYSEKITAGYESLDPGVYTFTYGATTVVNYTKTAGQDWTAIRNIFDPLKVAGFNTMTITLKGTAGKSVLLKPNDQGALEQRVDFVDANPITVTVTAASFVNLILFGEPGVSPATGSFEIVSLYLSYVAPENTFDPTAIYSFNNEWFVNNGSVYSLTPDGSKLIVNYTKVGGQDWEWFRRTFDPAMVMGFNTMTVVLQGTAGKQVLLKPNDSGALEKFVTFGAEPSVVTIYSETGFLSLFVFGDPGVAPATGSFEILSATLSYSYNMQSTWVQNDPGTYAVVPGATVTVNYTKAEGQEWVFLKNTFPAEELAGMNTLTLVLQGTLGKQVLVKVNNAVEQWVTFTAEPTVVVMSLPEITGVILFAEGGVAPATGSFQIISAYLSFVPVEFDPQSTLNLFNGWVENDPGTYATVVGASVVVNYTKAEGQEWVFIKNPFVVEDAIGYNTFTITLKGTVGKQVLVKVNNSIEKWVTFADANPVTVVIRANEITGVILFAEGGVAPVTGSFEIVSARLSYSLDLMSGWVENDPGTYAVSGTSPVTIDYTKGAGQEWVFVKNPFDVEDAIGMNTLTITLQGTLGKQVLVKVNNSIEQWVTFTAEPTTVVIIAPSITGLILFAEGGTASVTGSFQILSATLTYVPQP
jgi:fumarate reductase subunit C